MSAVNRLLDMLGPPVCDLRLPLPERNTPTPPPSILAVCYKRTRVLIAWPETYEDLLRAVRLAFPGLPADDARVFFETRVRIDMKNYHKVERKIPVVWVRLTPDAWGGLPKPSGSSEGQVAEVVMRTQRKAWNLIKVYQSGCSAMLEKKVSWSREKGIRTLALKVKQ